MLTLEAVEKFEPKNSASVVAQSRVITAISQLHVVREMLIDDCWKNEPFADEERTQIVLGRRVFAGRLSLAKTPDASEGSFTLSNAKKFNGSSTTYEIDVVGSEVASVLYYPPGTFGYHVSVHQPVELLEQNRTEEIGQLTAAAGRMYRHLHKFVV